MKHIVVDVEADGQCPFNRNMLWFGAVCVEDLAQTFDSGLVKPIYCDTDWRWREFRFDDLHKFTCIRTVMAKFKTWLDLFQDDRLLFVSDNNGWDYQWINYYFHYADLKNPFGHTSMNLGSFYKGVVRDRYKNFKHLRETKHDHNPVNDAMGNAEAMKKILEVYQVK